jgi:hypothetical protein
MFTNTDPSSTDTGGRDVSKEDDKATIAALLEERRGYEMRGQADRVAQVDRQLSALGHNAAKASARAEKRPRRAKATRR